MTILEFVTEKHKNQIRKYTNEPYVNHLIRVAGNFEKDSYLYNLALCHDLFEDTDCTKDELSLFLMNYCLSFNGMSNNSFCNLIWRDELKKRDSPYNKFHTKEEIEKSIIEGVSNYIRVFILQIVALTDFYTKKEFSDNNRKWRKQKECKRLSEISPEAMTVKYADLIDNCDIVLHDKSFGKVYLQEMFDILKHCKQGDFDLYYKAMVKHSEMIKLL